MIIEVALFALVVASWVYWIVAWWWTREFFLEPAVESDFTPPVSLLKPLCGLDPGLRENLISFCEQDYPEFELLCGVADAADPVVPLVEQLQRDFSNLRIRLIVAAVTGANRKASILQALAAEASHEVLVISDSDMRVTPEYLRRVVSPLAEDDIGLVTCPYRGEAPLTFTARLEALHMTATFLPCVIVARRFLRMRFAMGATVALRQGDLERSGGFAALVDHLADDFQLAQRLTGLGLRVRLSQYVVSSVLGATTFREQWQREMRWAKTNRVSRPAEYPGMLLTFSTPLSALLVVVSGLSPLAWEALAISLLVRWIVAWSVMGCVKDCATRRWLAWLPLRDMLSALVWCSAGTGRRINWRGQEYRLRADGRMQPCGRAVAREKERGLA